VSSFACSKSAADDDSAANDGATQHNWSCSDSVDGTSCTCEDLRPGVQSIGLGKVDVCDDHPCCLLTNHETMASTADCTCIESPDCQAEAASRSGASVVPACPPGVQVTPPACAATNENCRPDYLAQNGLVGCCAGTLCKTGSNGIPVCQAASDAELAQAATCMRAAKSDMLNTLTITQGTLVTSVGTLKFDSISSAFLDAGTTGCVTGIDITFSGGSSCTLNLTVGVQSGALVVTHVVGFFSGCSGYTGNGLTDDFVSASNPSGIGLSLSGTSCDGSPSYCFAGELDWHIDTQFDTVTISDQHLVTDGGLCAVTAMGDCPTQ
jgi:hypothetical protein